MMQEELDIPIADEGLCQVPQAALTRENRHELFASFRGNLEYLRSSIPVRYY